jgi:hypothetical protein
VYVNETIVEEVAKLALLAVGRDGRKVVLIRMGGHGEPARQQNTGQQQDTGQAASNCT